MSAALDFAAYDVAEAESEYEYEDLPPDELLKTFLPDF